MLNIQEIRNTLIQLARNNLLEGKSVQLNQDLFTVLPPSVWDIISPRLLLNLVSSNLAGFVNIDELTKLIHRKCLLIKWKQALDKISRRSDGYLTDSELRLVISSIVSDLPKMKNRIIHKYYTEFVVQVVQFFIGSQTRKMTKITDFLGCGILQEFYHTVTNGESELPKDSLVQLNYFYCLYFQFTIDSSVSKGIKKQSLYKMFNMDICEGFWYQFYRKYSTKNGIIDFAAFIKLNMALKYPTENRSVKFLFSILDGRDKGYINKYDIHYFIAFHLKRIKWNLKNDGKVYDKSLNENESAWLSFSGSESKRLHEKILVEGYHNHLFDSVLSRGRGTITCLDLQQCTDEEIEKFIMSLIKYSYFSTLVEEESKYGSDNDEDGDDGQGDDNDEDDEDEFNSTKPYF